MDSNFRFRVRCKRGLRRKSPASAACSPSIICGCRRWPSAKAQSEISEPNPYRARNRKFESISLQQTVRLSPDFAFVPRKSPGLPAVWERGRAARSAETRKVQQHRAEERECLCRAIFQYRSVADTVRSGGGAGAKRGRAARDSAISIKLKAGIGSSKAQRGPLIVPSQR